MGRPGLSRSGRVEGVKTKGIVKKSATNKKSKKGVSKVEERAKILGIVNGFTITENLNNKGVRRYFEEDIPLEVPPSAKKVTFKDEVYTSEESNPTAESEAADVPLVLPAPRTFLERDSPENSPAHSADQQQSKRRRIQENKLVIEDADVRKATSDSRQKKIHFSNSSDEDLDESNDSLALEGATEERRVYPKTPARLESPASEKPKGTPYPKFDPSTVDEESQGEVKKSLEKMFEDPDEDASDKGDEEEAASQEDSEEVSEAEDDDDEAETPQIGSSALRRASNSADGDSGDEPAAEEDGDAEESVAVIDVNPPETMDESAVMPDEPINEVAPTLPEKDPQPDVEPEEEESNTDEAIRAGPESVVPETTESPSEQVLDSTVPGVDAQEAELPNVAVEREESAGKVEIELKVSKITRRVTLHETAPMKASNEKRFSLPSDAVLLQEEQLQLPEDENSLQDAVVPTETSGSDVAESVEPVAAPMIPDDKATEVVESMTRAVALNSSFSRRMEARENEAAESAPEIATEAESDIDAFKQRRSQINLDDEEPMEVSMIQKTPKVVRSEGTDSVEKAPAEVESKAPLEQEAQQTQTEAAVPVAELEGTSATLSEKTIVTPTPIEQVSPPEGKVAEEKTGVIPSGTSAVKGSERVAEIDEPTAVEAKSDSKNASSVKETEEKPTEEPEEVDREADSAKIEEAGETPEPIEESQGKVQIIVEELVPSEAEEDSSGPTTQVEDDEDDVEETEEYDEDERTADGETVESPIDDDKPEVRDDQHAENEVLTDEEESSSIPDAEEASVLETPETTEEAQSPVKERKKRTTTTKKMTTRKVKPKEPKVEEPQEPELVPKTPTKAPKRSTRVKAAPAPEVPPEPETPTASRRVKKTPAAATTPKASRTPAKSKEPKESAAKTAPKSATSVPKVPKASAATPSKSTVETPVKKIVRRKIVATADKK